MENKENKLFLNRDLSWIEFNKRVLDESFDTSLPLLERVKFLSIFCSNLDEFYMIRISGLVEQIELGVNDKGIDGYSASETLKSCENRIRPMIKSLIKSYQEDLLPKLHAEGINISDYDNFSEHEKLCIDEYFDKEIFPVLTPLAFDPGRPFPHISNLSINLGVLIERPNEGEKHFARIKVPNNLPRIVNINKILKKYDYKGQLNGNVKITFIEQIISANIYKLFPKMNILDTYVFRITRDTDLEIQEDEADDLLKSIEENIRKRKFGSVVRLELEKEILPEIKSILINNLEIDENLVHTLNGPVGLSDLIELMELPFARLKSKPYSPIVPKIFDSNENIFKLIRSNDILLSHPYHSFSPVSDFIKQAASDPNVLAIKQTLYRVGNNSPIVESLIEAAENGKQVAVLVELKARFDEENNILWARRLEKVGVHVVYGLIGLKTHCKVAMVVRKEDDGLMRYVHLGTGNYNTVTSKIYTDFGFFTCDNNISSDTSELFNFLTGYSRQDVFKDLLVAPINLREKLEHLIEKEIENHKKHSNGRLIFKFNSLTDPKMIKTLYRAAEVGVKIELIIRGTCMLKPGIKNISDNITVKSIVGRYLEHARIFYFFNNGNPVILLGSADLMERNLNRRVEVLFPIKNKNLKNYIYKNILCVQLNDNINSSILNENGFYDYCIISDSEDKKDCHLIQRASALKDISWAARK